MDPNIETRLGPAERIIQTVLSQGESHMVHARPGIVNADPSTPIGFRWRYVTTATEGGETIVYALGRDPKTKRETKTRLGMIVGQDEDVRENGQTVGQFRTPGVFREVAAWLYRQVAEVWKIDNEFAARWASYAFGEEHRDLKVVLAAFMLCQSRKGDPVREGDRVAFKDEDFRAVGEAMALLTRKDDRDFSPKLLRRVLEVLWVPEVAAINRELGFTRSRAPFLGRWEHAARMYLQYREENPKMLEGLVKAGFRTTVIDLVGLCRYRPSTPKFFKILRYKQVQAEDGRRKLQIGAEVDAVESWVGFSEQRICEQIIKDKPNFKRIESLLSTSEVGLTRAVMAAAIEAGSLSNKDLIMRTPTLEDLGLMAVQSVKERWEKALRDADDMRAANIALRVRSKEAKDALQTAAEDASKKAVEEAVRDMRIYVVVDVSGSMQPAIEAAKAHLARFVPVFPLDRLHVSIFNTVGREIEIKHASAAGVENAFRGVMAQGGTNYAQGVISIGMKHKPKPGEDVLFIFVGDQQDNAPSFVDAFTYVGFRPNAFGFVRVIGTDGTHRRIVERTAELLGIPCFLIDERTFADAYAVPRTIRNLIAATPVGATSYIDPSVQRRETLVEKILKTEILKKPAWAA